MPGGWPVTRQFSEQQTAAIRATGTTLVAAAAGSGKTGVLVERIVRAATDQHIPLANIVAITFTELAAGEVRERVGDRLLELGRADLVSDLQRAPIGTIHSLCIRLLRDHAHTAQLDPGFTILDPAQTTYLRRTAITRAIEEWSLDPAAIRIRTRYSDQRLAGYLEAAYDAAQQRPDTTVSWGSESDIDSELHSADALQIGALYGRFCAIYAADKASLGGCDFDEVQHRALRLFEHPDTAQAIRRSVHMLLVDEFQDTNRIQCAVVDALDCPETFLVGDEWQSIYRFRNADVRVFRERAETTASLPMDRNWRSRDEIIQTVNGIFGPAFEQVSAGHEFPALVPTQGATGRASDLLLVRGAEGQDPREAEAEAVAERIAALRADGVPANEIAILMAAGTRGDLYERALRERGIACMRSQSRGFQGLDQVRDIIQLLRWVRDRTDEMALYSVLAAPYVNLQPREMLKLRVQARAVAVPGERLGQSLWRAVAASDDPAVQGAVRLRRELAEVARTGTLVSLVSAALHRSGYAAIALEMADGRRRYANMRKLLDVAAEAMRVGATDVGSFVDVYESHRDVRAEMAEASLADEQSGSVRIMTVHASKGLEFPHVFVVDTANAGSPSRGMPELVLDDDGTAVFELVDRAGVQVICPQRLTDLRQRERDEDEAEQRRAYYVALTRAREHLTVSGALTTRWAKSPLGWITRALGIDLSDDAPVGSTKLATAPVTAHVINDVAPHAAPTSTRALSAPAAVDSMRLLAAQPTQRPAAVAASDGSRHTERTRAGERRHAQLAMALRRARGESVPALAAALPDVRHVVTSDVFAELVQLGAEPEVPYLTSGANGRPERGRFDAVVRTPTHWRIVDFKSSLPDANDVAWHQHAPQLLRYADAAREAGAPSVTLQLIDLSDPERRLLITADELRQQVGRSQPIAHETDDSGQLSLTV